MNRIVKFRGKRIDNGEWVYGGLIYNLDPHQEKDVVAEVYIRQPLRNIGRTYEVHPESVGQLITIKDKIEYYENDIVVVDNRLTALTYTGVGFNGVYFNDDGSWDDEWEDKLSLRDKWELRGNTTDTPELLTV